MPEGEYDSYDFCPWCSKSLGRIEPRMDESRKIIERQLAGWIAIQCSECGGEYDQPARYPYRFCAACGAPFAAEDGIIIELPWLV